MRGHTRNCSRYRLHARLSACRDVCPTSTGAELSKEPLTAHGRVRLTGMRATVLLSLVFVGAAVSAAAQIELRPDQMKQDLEVMRSALYEAHGGLERFSSRAEHDKRFDHARSLFTRPMPPFTFIGILSEVLAGFRDGHMRLEYDSETNTALAAGRLLPLRVANEAGNIVVTHNDTPGDSKIMPGMQLLSVNGRPIEDVTKTILPKLSGDGFVETGRARLMARDFARNYWLFVDQSATFGVKAKAADGAVVMAQLEGVTSAERTRSANPVNAVIAAQLAKRDGSREPVSLQLPSDSIGVLRIRMFDGDSFPSSLAAAFASAKERGVRALILDLRANGGGVDEYGAMLVSYFVSAPFRYFDHIKVTTIRPSFATWRSKTFEDLITGTRPAPGGGFVVLPQLHSGVAEQKPSPSPFLGPLVVLIDGETFSTAADVSAQLRSLTKATFVGEETGGAFEGNTSGLNAHIVLPHSRLKLKIHMYGYWNAVRGDQRGRGTIPDVPILTRTADLLRGSDLALDRALAIARKSLQ